MADLISEGLDALAEAAPTLATMIGGPLAGTAVSAIERIFGITPAADASGDERRAAALSAVTSASPDQLLDLRQEDNRHAETLEKLAEDDRNSARMREESVKDNTPRILAFAAIGLFVGMVSYVMAGHLDMSGNEAALFGTVIGYVSSKADLVLSYYFGSSLQADQHAADLRKKMMGI